MNTTDRPDLPLQEINVGAVTWTQGFWKRRFDVCHRAMVPNMWQLLSDEDRCHAYANFRIAAGLQNGRHRGPKWHDGDFYKWLEAAASVYAITTDPDLDRLMDRVIDVIAKAQRPDGYIFTPVIIAHDRHGASAVPFENPEGFEMYNFGHLMTAACTHHLATGKRNLLDVAIRAGDFLCREFRSPTPEQAAHSVCPSHYMGLVDLYRTTGKQKYLNLVKVLIAMRAGIQNGTDDNQTRVPIRNQTQAVGHAVRANYLYAGLADIAIETADAELLQIIEKVWEDVAFRKVYITGACGALYDGASPDGAIDQKTISRTHQAYGRAYQLPNLTAYGETCAQIGYALWNWRMLRATGNARYADMLETVLYNSALASISLDGKRFFYTNPMRRLYNTPFELRWSRTREPYISCFCCPPNIVRTLAMLHQWAYAQSDKDLWVVLYGGNQMHTVLDGEQLRITQKTDYPWHGCIRLTIDISAPVNFALHLRIPEWVPETTVFVNGSPLQDLRIEKGFLAIRRIWSSGDAIELELPMRVQMMESHPMVEETRNQVAIKRGPIVYCLESHDIPEDASVSDVTLPPDVDFQPRDSEMLDGIVVLDGEVQLAANHAWSATLYREKQHRNTTRIPARLIPYYAWDNRGLSEMTVWIPLGTESNSRRDPP